MKAGKKEPKKAIAKFRHTQQAMRRKERGEL